MSIYVLAVDGVVKKYPYTLTDLRFDNPTVSFTEHISDEVAELFDTYLVTETPPPEYDQSTHRLLWVNPEFSNGSWVQRWDIEPLSQAEKDAILSSWRDNMVITPFQGRMALDQANLLLQVEAIVSQADSKTKTAWEYALEWKRTSPLISTLAGALNLTETQVDDLFKTASLIEA